MLTRCPGGLPGQWVRGPTYGYRWGLIRCYNEVHATSYGASMNTTLIANRNSRRHPLTAWTAAALAFAVATTLANAQVREVPGGHALDASPQVGSGGSNSPVPGY